MTISDTPVHSSDNELLAQRQKNMACALFGGAGLNLWFKGELQLDKGSKAKLGSREGYALKHEGKKVGILYHAAPKNGDLALHVEFVADHKLKRSDGKRTCTYHKGEQLDLVDLAVRWHEVDLYDFVLNKDVWATPEFAQYAEAADHKRRADRANSTALLEVINGGKKSPKSVTYTQAITSPLWQSRPWLTRVNDLSIQRSLNPFAVLMTMLGHVALRVRPEVIVSDPSDVSLNTFIMLLGRPGSGKGEITKLCKKLVKFADSPSGSKDFGRVDYTLGAESVTRPELLELTGWSGQGMSRTFTWLGKGEAPDHWQPPHALFTESEVANLIANGRTQSASQIPVMNKVFMGELNGSANADKSNRYQATAHSFRAVVIIEAQPEAVAPLFTDQGGDATGFTARLLVAPPRLATKAEIAKARKMRQAGELVRENDPAPVIEVDPRLCEDLAPNSDGLKAFPTAPDLLALIEDQLEDLYAVDTEVDDPTAGHTILIRRKAATLLAIASGEHVVTMEHWDMAGYLVDHSRDVVSKWRADNEERLREKAVIGKVHALQQDEEAENREYDIKVDACINYVLQHGSVAMSDLKRNGPLNRKWRASLDSIVEDMVDSGKVEKQEVRANQYRLVAKI